MAVLASGCPKDSQSSVGSSTSTAAPAVTASSLPAPESSGSTAATQEAHHQRCSAPQLQGRLEDRGQAMNQPSFWISLTNIGETCTLRGYPGVQLLDAAGRPVNMDIRRGGGFIAPDPGPRDVTVEHEGTAWFVVSSTKVCRSGEAPVSSAILVIPPDDRIQTRITAQIPYCPGESNVAVSALSPDERSLHLH
jgi:hypothetical protein